MNEQKPEAVVNSRPKWSSTTTIALFLLVILSINRTKSDELCEAIVVDAITQMDNKSIVIFRNKEVWFVDQKENQLIGPCPITNIFKEMSGPVDAAITITKHETITDFIGSGVYFENQNFYTFRNLGQYQVEWGALTYMPHKGEQKDMGNSLPEAQNLMKQTISFAYFDPIDSKSKFVFPDGSVLSFTFDMGAQYDIPDITTIKEELNKYGVDLIPKTLTAALTLTENKVSELYLFNGSTFCSIKMNRKLENQNCDLRPIKEFLNCDSIKRTNEFCLGDTHIESPEKPIAGKDSAEPDSPVIESNSKPESKVQIRSDDQSSTEKDKQSLSGSDSLAENGFVFALTFISMAFVWI